MSSMASHRSFKVQIKESIKAPRHWPLWGEFTEDRWIPRTEASNAENVSIWWRHHDFFKTGVTVDAGSYDGFPTQRANSSSKSLGGFLVLAVQTFGQTAGLPVIWDAMTLNESCTRLRLSYLQISNISRTKSQNLDVSRHVL